MQTEEMTEPGEPLFQVQAPQRQKTWYFVTNNLNLMYMLAAGLIMPPLGFGKKYYADSLNVLPGWIPLFSGNVPQKIINDVVRESPNLKPVIVALDLSCLDGPALTVTINNKISDINLPEELVARHAIVFVPAPLPTALIESICFSSKEDKTAFDKDAMDYANVPIKLFKRTIAKRMFGRTSHLELIRPESFSDVRNVSMNNFMAAGAMMAMLVSVGNMGDFAALACKTAFDGPCDDDMAMLDGTIVQGLDYFMDNGMGPTAKSMSDSLFWGSVNRIVQLDTAVTSSHLQVLDFLKQFNESADVKYRDALSRFISELDGIAQFGAKNATDLFESHPREVRRALILFFLRDRCADLMDFAHPFLTERDYVAAALLFAAREKWIGLPLQIRDYPGLDRAITHRMAAKAHQALKTGMRLGPAPPRCMPLRELFKPALSGWTKKQTEAALSLARDMNWPCIDTSIRIGKGEYALKVDAAGITICFPGETRAVNTEIKKEKFFDLMAENPFIANKVQKKALQHLLPT